MLVPTAYVYCGSSELKVGGLSLLQLGNRRPSSSQSQSTATQHSSASPGRLFADLLHISCRTVLPSLQRQAQSLLTEPVPNLTYRYNRFSLVAVRCRSEGGEEPVSGWAIPPPPPKRKGDSTETRPAIVDAQRKWRFIYPGIDLSLIVTITNSNNSRNNTNSHGNLGSLDGKREEREREKKNTRLQKSCLRVELNKGLKTKELTRRSLSPNTICVIILPVRMQNALFHVLDDLRRFFSKNKSRKEKGIRDMSATWCVLLLLWHDTLAGLMAGGMDRWLIPHSN